MFDSMAEHNCQPDAVTFANLIRAYKKGGQWYVKPTGSRHCHLDPMTPYHDRCIFAIIYRGWLLQCSHHYPKASDTAILGAGVRLWIPLRPCCSLAAARTLQCTAASSMSSGRLASPGRKSRLWHSSTPLLGEQLPPVYPA